MENGANMNTKSETGKSPLDIAVQERYISCVEAMISNCEFLSDKIVDRMIVSIPASKSPSKTTWPAIQ